MGKLVYICAGQDIEDKTSGISKKISSQIDFFKKNGFDVCFVNINNKMKRLECIKFVLPLVYSKYEKNMLLIDKEYNISWEKVNYVYIRNITASKGFLDLVKRIKKINPSIKICLELPTYPNEGEYTGLKKIQVLNMRYYSRNYKKYVDRIITYSRDRDIWGIPTIMISNTVDFNKIEPRKPIKHEGINIIAVAFFSRWHGYDRLIKGIREYYKQESSKAEKIHLYLVGTGEYKRVYEGLVKKYKLENYITFTGALSGKKLDNIYNIADIGIDAMGRHRSGVFYNSSLKGKEYGCKGLPIVSGVQTELDYIDGFSYYLRVPANDTNIKIKEIVEFYHKVYDKKNIQEIINTIRKFNEDRFSFDNIFSKVISYYNHANKE